MLIAAEIMPQKHSINSRTEQLTIPCGKLPIMKRLYRKKLRRAIFGQSLNHINKKFVQNAFDIAYQINFSVIGNCDKSKHQYDLARHKNDHRHIQCYIKGYKVAQIILIYKPKDQWKSIFRAV